MTLISAIYGAYFALTSPKEYTSKAIFEIEATNNQNFSMPSELGTLASIAGLGNPSSSWTDSLLERIRGREFILDLAQTVSLEQDPLFNNFGSPTNQPFWKVRIKNLWHRKA